MTDHALPPPDAFGLPYTEWRDNQPSAILQIVDSQSRFITQVAPTGFGKSLAYVSAAVLLGGRTIILTSTKGLQSQLLRDFSCMGMVDIRGRNAYVCRMEKDGTTCDHGPCIAGVKCQLKDEGGCDYYDALRAARLARVVSTNYAYWMTANEYGEGLGMFDLMVCDEAHSTPDTVSSFLTIVLDRKDEILREIIPKGDLIHLSVIEWKAWAKANYQHVTRASEELKRRVAGGAGSRNLRRKLSKIKSLQTKLRKISTDVDNTWVMDNDAYHVSFSPVWPAPYCEKALFRQVNRIVLTSATVCQKSADMLGVVAEHNDMTEFPHSFPIENRMLTHVPTVRMNFRTDKMGIRKWLNQIDQIVKARRDRNGIIHTVSYKRRDEVLANSKYADLMVTHARRNAEETVQRFKQMRPPAVLVSPSMSTGWDFPYDTCRFQIIGKIAYPDTRNRIVKARTKEDADYGAYVAMQQLVQAAGRATRAKDDWCENIIIDDNIGWFMKRHAKFAPRWFTGAFQCRATVPVPPGLIEGKWVPGSG